MVHLVRAANGPEPFERFGEATLETDYAGFDRCHVTVESPESELNRFQTRVQFVNSPEGKQLHLRGINTKIVRAGVIQIGDIVKKIPAI